MRWAWLLTVAACASARAPVVGEPGPTAKNADDERAWVKLLDRHTARASIYDGLDTRAFVAATWQSPAFAEARVRRDGEFRALPPAEVDAAWEAEKARLADATELTFGAHVVDHRYDDFDRKSSVWRLTLTHRGQALAPLEIHRVGRATVARRAFYPYLDDFWVEYVVRFPHVEPAAGEKLTLTVASALGKAELELTAP